MSPTKAPPGFDTIHRILGGAMRAVDELAWPALPHLGGPLPVLSTQAQLEVGLVVCATARTLAPPADLSGFDERAQLAREVAGGARLPKPQLDAASKPRKADDVGMKVAKLTVRAAYNHLYAAASARNAAGFCVENAAHALAGHVAAARPAELPGLLDTIDQAILRRELAAHLADRSFVPTSPVARIVSRPPPVTGKALGLVLAALADGRYGLFVKLRQRWDWHEGDRATVFATVPDAYMEHVIADLDA